MSSQGGFKGFCNPFVPVRSFHGEFHGTHNPTRSFQGGLKGTHSPFLPPRSLQKGFWGIPNPPSSSHPFSRAKNKLFSPPKKPSSPSFFGAGTHSVFMLRMARRDMMASVTAFLNCLGENGDKFGVTARRPGPKSRPEGAHLMARYMGRMAKRGKVCTLIMMVMKAM